MFVAVVAAITLSFLEPFILPLLKEKIVSVDGLYSSVFGWSAIQTGFLFSVFGYIAGKQGGFIEAVRNTRAMHLFQSDLKLSIYVGFVLTLTSMIVIVFDFSPEEGGKGYIAICIWWGLFFTAFLTFCKVAYEFGTLVGVPDSDDIQSR